MVYLILNGGIGMNNKSKGKASGETKTYQKILISISTLLLLGIIFFVSYHFTTGKTKSSYIDSIYAQKLKIDDINTTAAAAVKDIDKLDPSNKDGLQSIVTKVAKAEASIQSCIKDLSKISPPAKYKDHYSLFLEALSLNKKIYTQTNLILKNTKSKDLQKAIDALDKNIGDATTAYENSKLDKVYIKLPGEILTLWDKVGSYAMNSYSNYESKARLLEQYTEYFNSMDKIIENFTNEKQDLKTYIDAISAGKTSIGDVYAAIENKLSKLNSIKNSYTKLSVPSKTAAQHRRFNDIINNYSSYCEEYKSALTELEEAGSNQDALMEVNISLEELYVKLEEINVSYNEYKDLYDKDKDMYMNIDNL